MLMRRTSLLARLTALLLSVATPSVPVGMAVMSLSPAAEAPGAMMDHEGMHHPDSPASPTDAYRCCDLCAVACHSTGALPAGAFRPAIDAPWYETVLPAPPLLPRAAAPSLRLPFAQAPPALLI